MLEATRPIFGTIKPTKKIMDNKTNWSYCHLQLELLSPVNKHMTFLIQNIGLIVT